MSVRSQSKLSQPSPLSIAYTAIDTLRLDPKNPRLHSRKQVKQLARSIQTFGFNVPLLIDADLTVIAGHGRLAACRQLGWSEVPTIRLDHLDEAQRRAFMLADNRLSETSTWDDGLLAEHLRDLSLVDLDFDLEATGFDMGEIDLRIESLTKEDAPSTAPSEASIASFQGPAVCRPGDLWLLGRHRLLCGNALDPDDLARVMDGDKAAGAFTDPPYNVRVRGHVTKRDGAHREFAMASGEMEDAAFQEFLTKALELLARHTHSGSLHYLCMDWRHAATILAAGHAVYRNLVNLCVWTKPNAGMGSFYRSQHELVFVFRSGAAAFRNNVELGRHGRNRSNVWAYAGQQPFGRAGEEGRLADLHPTVKPVAMVADAMLDATRRGDIVLDPFLGSGTTLIAAERTGRRCYGLEIDPLYADVIIRRWQAHTGAAARHATLQRSFDAIAADENAMAGVERDG